MELTNEFEVAVPVEKAWEVLTDLERIAPCLPGAQLREVEGDEYRGSVKIKVGPITTSYDGAIRFIELDESAHRAVMKAEGRETRGQGNVSAIITATMLSSGTITKVTVATDLSITGKVAQFGRGVLAEVSAKLLDQFVVNLESKVLVQNAQGSLTSAGPPVDSGTAGNASPSKPAPKSKRVRGDAGTVTPGANGDDPASRTGDADPEGPPGAPKMVRQIDSEPAEPIDLVDIAGASFARRLLKPVVILGVVAAVVVRLIRRHHR
jgi:carbon monoxide dehydrogenase subunit G